MLDSFRKFAGSIFGKVLLGLLLIAMAGFGIQGVLQSIGSNVVAKVGGQDITTREFQRAYQAEMNQAAQQTGSMPTAQQAVAMGIPGATLARLAVDSALNRLAGQLDLGASDKKLGELLRQDPSFAGAGGKFDRATFNRVLQMNGFTESDYLKNLRQSAERQQIVMTTIADMPAPKAAVDLLNRYYGDTRTLDYFVLTPDSALPPDAPTDKDMQAYLAAHQAQYRTAPTRTAEFLVLSPKILAENVTVTDSEIAARYDQEKASLIKPEKRTISQVSLPDAAAVAAFKKELSEGKSFAQAVSDLKLTPIDLGALTKSQITDKDLAKAAFAMEADTVDFIPGALGTRAVTVTKIAAGGEKTLAEAQDQILTELKLKKAQAKYSDILDQVEEQRAALKPIGEVAKMFDLKTETVTLSEDGKALSAVTGIPSGNRARVAKAVFNQEMGNLAPGIALSSELNVWFDLKKITKARDETLDEVRTEISKTLTDQRIDAELKKTAEDAVEAIKGGKVFEDAAMAGNVSPQVSQPISRNGGKGDLDRTVMNAAFDGPQGLVGYAKSGTGNYVVFKVQSVTPASAKNETQLEKPVENALRNDVYAEFVNGLRIDAGMSVNQQVLTQIVGAN